MSIISNFLENGIGNLVKNIFLGAIKESEGLVIYINLKWGKYILSIEAVETREIPQFPCIYFFIAFEGLILRVILKQNNE